MLLIRTDLTGLSGGPYLSTMHFAGSTLANAQDAADAVRTFWNAVRGEFSPAQTAQVQSDVTVLDDITGEPTGLHQVTAPAAVVGLAAGEALPYGVQELVRWRTGSYIAGREIRGRTFIPGMCEPQNDNGRPTAASVATITAAAAALIADPDCNLIVYSRKNQTGSQVQSGTCWNQFANLRSRRDS